MNAAELTSDPAQYQWYIKGRWRCHGSDGLIISKEGRILHEKRGQPFKKQKEGFSGTPAILSRPIRRVKGKGCGSRSTTFPIFSTAWGKGLLPTISSGGSFTSTGPPRRSPAIPGRRWWTGIVTRSSESLFAGSFAFFAASRFTRIWRKRNIPCRSLDRQGTSPPSGDDRGGYEEQGRAVDRGPGLVPGCDGSAGQAQRPITGQQFCRPGGRPSPECGKFFS